MGITVGLGHGAAEADLLMIFPWKELCLILLAYGIGSIPFGYLIVQFAKGFDIRSFGSGNIGATNVMRAMGRWGALWTLLLDVAKGFVVVWAADVWSSHNPVVLCLSAIAVFLGHLFPVFLGFRGGKGVATGLGIFLYLAWLPTLCTLAVFAAVVLWTRYVSLGSIAAALVLPVFFWLLRGRQPLSPWILASVCLCSGLIILKHLSNLQRLMHGSENKLSGFGK